MQSVEHEDKSRIRNSLSRTWLIGEFITNSKKARLAAFYEILFGLGVGTLPFWVSGFVLFVIGKPSGLPDDASILLKLLALTVSAMDQGELLIFAVSFVAPALWLAAHEPEDAKPLPHRRPILALTGLVGVLCPVLYALSQAGVVKNTDFLFRASLIFAIVSLSTMYLALTYHLFRLPKVSAVNEVALLASQQGFVEAMQRRHSGGQS